MNYWLPSILKEPQVYIANVIKCRPPENRDPLPTEIANCQKWLDRQIELISPENYRYSGKVFNGQVLPGEDHQ
jgi:uracil-DNA glycosylase family 4